MLYYFDYEVHGHCTVSVNADSLQEASMIADEVELDLNEMDVAYIDLYRVEDADGEIY